MPNFLPFGIHQRQVGHLCLDPFPQDFHLQRGPGLGQLRRQVDQTNVLADGVAVAAGADPVDHPAPGIDRLPAIKVAAGIHGQRAYSCPQPFLLDGEQGFPADEVRLFQPHAETEARLERVVRGGDVPAPVEIAFLDPQGVQCLVARRPEAVLLAGPH